MVPKLPKSVRDVLEERIAQLEEVLESIHNSATTLNARLNELTVEETQVNAELEEHRAYLRSAIDGTDQ